MKLTGTCKNRITGFRRKSRIDFSIKDQEILVYAFTPDMGDLLSKMQSYYKWKVNISDIDVLTHSARLKCKKLPAAFVSSISPGGISSNDGDINKILDLNDNKFCLSGIGIKLRKGRIRFEIEPLAKNILLQPEMLFTNNKKYLGESFPVAIKRRQIMVRYGTDKAFITGSMTNKEQEVFRYVNSLVSLTRENIITSW